MSISIPFEEFLVGVKDSGSTSFDCLIIGSGYGGAVAANTFSKYNKADGSPLNICLLERGKEYLPGSFPAGLNEAIVHFPVPQFAGNTGMAEDDKLYDIRNSKTHWIMGGNGVGGGSLINAGVMLAPDAGTLEDPAWPAQARSVLTDNAFMDGVGVMLGSRLAVQGDTSIENTVTRADVVTEKFHALSALGGKVCGITATPLSIRLSEDEPDQAVATAPCIGCGNCFSGCNFNAKKSLDTNLLAEAGQRGVTIVNGAQTLFFTRHGAGWKVYVVYSSAKLRYSEPKPLELYCEKLIISAGSIGSTELLLRSQYYARSGNGNQNVFSEQLGKRFFGNGDMIASIVNRSEPVNMIADDAIADKQRNIGPTNSGMLDFRNKKQRVVLQELAVPGVLQRAMIEGISFTQVRDALIDLRQGLKAKSGEFIGLSQKQLAHLTIIAGIGADRSEGTISLVHRRHLPELFEAKNFRQWLPQIEIGYSGTEAALSWAAHRKTVLDLLDCLRKKNDQQSAVLENPIGDPLGDTIGRLFGVSKDPDSGIAGRLMSVHPLGGCSMSDNADNGVVNPYGQVYLATDSQPVRSNPTEVYKNLVVLDGAIVPVPVDINPAMTIAALALNASDKLAAEWGWTPRTDTEDTVVTKTRKAVRSISPELRDNIKPTRLTLTERLVGCVEIEVDGVVSEFIAEIRLRSAPFSVDQFTDGQALNLQLLNAPQKDPADRLPEISTLRLFRKPDWDSMMVAGQILLRRKKMQSSGQIKSWIDSQLSMIENSEVELDRLAVLIVPLSGSVTVMEEVTLNPLVRIKRGFSAWWYNRLLRDLLQSRHNVGNLWTTIKSFARAPAICLQTGREHRLVYELRCGVPTVNKLQGVAGLWENKVISGTKSYRYHRHANPLTQLMSVQISKFPNTLTGKQINLGVDLGYFAKVNVPLFGVDQESDAVTGYADLLALGNWFARITLLQFFWLLRKPDKPSEFPERLRPAARITDPVALPGLSHNIEVYPIQVADPNHKNPGVTCIRLSRFRHGEQNRSANPVLCIHGFSLGWSMFAHETLYGGTDNNGVDLKGGMAAYLARQGHDVWVIDLRSSGSLATAKVDWDFEEAALIDIPVALQAIAQKTGCAKVNVIAHCMGAMKLSMLMMCSDTLFARYNHCQDLTETRNLIGNIVLSQAGPIVRFSPANRLRERILSVIKNYKGFEIQFEESADGSLTEDIVDRLLNAMPYPEEEIKIENPLYGNRFWVRGRHRMDALYGKTFSLKNMDQKVLERFHDFFGPLSLRKLEQVIWFSRRNQISDSYGGEYRLDKEKLKKVWTQKTLWIHGEDNELLDPVSPVLTMLVFDRAGLSNLQVEILKNFGHQDCMMGRDCEIPYALIDQHLQPEEPASGVGFS